MKNLIARFETIMNEKVETLQFFEGGISNDNYLINHKYIMRQPKPYIQPFFDRINEKEIEEQLLNKNISFQTLYIDNKGYKISLYEPVAANFNSKNLNDENIIQIALKIRELHNLKLKSNKDFDVFNRIVAYREMANIRPLKEEDEIIANAKEFYKNQELILCHNDLVKGNILFKDYQVYIIDFEYASNNDPFFDLLSFITENNIDDYHLIETFLKAYDPSMDLNQIKDKFLAYINLLNLLWYYWACMMFKYEKKTIFKIIATEKLEKLNSILV